MGTRFDDWFLARAERGNSATRLRAWTEGNHVRPLVHGRAYFAALAAVLTDTGEGDLVLFADWRGDPDQRLTAEGLTVTEALSAAARRGALVKGLLWRSHLDRQRFPAEQNHNLAEQVVDDGGRSWAASTSVTVGGTTPGIEATRRPWTSPRPP